MADATNDNAIRAVMSALVYMHDIGFHGGDASRLEPLRQRLEPMLDTRPPDCLRLDTPSPCEPSTCSAPRSVPGPCPTAMPRKPLATMEFLDVLKAATPDGLGARLRMTPPKQSATIMVCTVREDGPPEGSVLAAHGVRPLTEAWVMWAPKLSKDIATHAASQLRQARAEGRNIWRVHFVCTCKTTPAMTKLMQDANVPSMQVSCCIPSKSGDDPVLLCPITNHCMVPVEYRVLMPDEVASAKRMYRTLPRMKPDDPQALARGLIEGTVVKVIMPDMLGDQYAEVRASD